ncbi:uncharacterized protein LOC110458393 isoform X2 [Mizuhopecten yessoensis]|uniref:Poly [ADP-ribose] polymerase 12 n=1 Tax=Mizuhopecten yessoensis TaxID=6573 RepID=A0A210Q6P8_MIZYE|nr:uncharacterized protein LOC110458393 isoform X1 [Mizuhopecten yessoensis]XP_021365744.1 uncharacterized protein LOC110458393 isoform X1 [Mizuhopecten yessoensis]XP_021365745.1 uncharacterized protein LOC110458393 isoform X1 [Mizuhopecten yessoensis]XP_021365746.1 uncharacterized protein LOC110458393 isoform X2 [Mizuhopecten yessoensis]OWF44413.1 Poly [ADP-ribose] polymerase 12 [Mizuhopecten yessoensis]
MDTQNQGKSGRGRKRGGKGRKDKQMSSSVGPETRSTSNRKENPTGPDVNDTSGVKVKAGNKPGPIRQTDDKLKSTSPMGNSQVNNKTASKKRTKTSQSFSRESSAHTPPHSTTRNSGQTDGGTGEDLFRQTKQKGKSNQQPFPYRPDGLVSYIVEILVNNGGSIQITSLQKSHRTLYRDMLKLSSDNTCEGFIHDHRHVLRGSPDTGNVKIMSFISSLDICKEHGSTVGSCPNECRSLHICKFQMMNECSRGKKCLFGHNLRNEYNWYVLRSHYMERLSNKQIREFLGSLDNRRGLTIPGICSYYNSMKGCGKPDKCPFLHICEHYIRGDCRFGLKKCCRSHDLSDIQPQCILEKYGLSGTKFSDLQRIIRKELELKEANSSSCDKDSLSPSNVYDSDDADVQSNGCPGSNLCSSYSQIRHQWGRSDHDNETEDMSSSSCDDKESDEFSNEYGEEAGAYSKNDSGIRGRLPTVNKELHCLPAWTCNPTHESLQQAPKVDVHDKEEQNDYIMPAKISSSVDNRGIQPQVTRSPVSSYDHCWRVSTGTDEKTTELTAGEYQELDFLYQMYLRARQCTMSLSGRTMTINFETMTGSVTAGEDEEKLVISRD